MNQANQERALGRLWAHLAGLRGRLAGLVKERRRYADTLARNQARAAAILEAAALSPAGRDRAAQASTLLDHQLQELRAAAFAPGAPRSAGELAAEAFDQEIAKTRAELDQARAWYARAAAKRFGRQA